MKILVTEDNFVARKVLCNFLQDYGTVDIASDGNEALEAVKMSLEEKDPYQLICLDILMPRMDGNEALVAIRAAEAEGNFPKMAKIIMISSLEDSSTILKSFFQQCDGYIKKPITLSLLKKELQKMALID